MPSVRRNKKPVVIVTGIAGNIGTALAKALKPSYTLVGLDRKVPEHTPDTHVVDFASAKSITAALGKIRRKHGKEIAAVIHLAAYFDFTGEYHPAYTKGNVEGTHSLLKALKDFEVARFIYASSMLVHRPGEPGERIDEETPIDPQWIYPSSKAQAEEVIMQRHGKIPYTILRLSGVYDGRTAVPTLSQQIARIYERKFKSHFYSGKLSAGQSFIHKEDMIEAFRLTLKWRDRLPRESVILVGEPEAVGYETLQSRIGELIHGEKEWKTLRVPVPVAKAGAFIEEKSEPLIPDAIDQGEKPFIRPFMIDMASHHYAPDIARARQWLGWTPKHKILDTLPEMIAFLKESPLEWYEANDITPPDWLASAAKKTGDPEKLRARHERLYRQQHRDNLWMHFVNLGLALWLVTSPPMLGYGGAMGLSDMLSGGALFFFALLSLSWQGGLARWGGALVGLWLLCAPLIFWTTSAAAYLNGTLVGMMAIGFAMLGPPVPGVAALAAETGPTVPKGWDFSPSNWFQRLPIIILAFIGLFVSRYLAAYQLGHIDSVWEPFFTGSAADPKNGTEEIITSSISEAWPVSDAGAGGVTYALEILTGIIGTSARWRTMPWLVFLFGLMIVPLGAVSITFIIIQPLLLGTWCTLCLVAAAAMLIQIPYSLDELVATGLFLRRRQKAGRPLLRVFFTGDTDDGPRKEIADDFAQPPAALIKDMLGGGVGLPWNLLLCILIGVWLMCTRLTLGAEGQMANADHFIGALVITVAVAALAEVARPARFLLLPLGLALLITPFVYGADFISTTASLACGLGLMLFSLRRGPLRHGYGEWDRVLV